MYIIKGLPGGSVVKIPPVNAGDARDAGLVPGSERCPGGGNGNPLRYSSPENPMHRLQSMGSQTDMTERLSRHACVYIMRGFLPSA